MNNKRHKVFVSYYHDDDQYYKNKLVEMEYFDYQSVSFKSIFDDYSVGIGDIDDTNMTDEQIRRKIRDEFIKNATVLVLLCGKNTKNRKHVDWEIHAAMYDSEFNPKMGIVVINLPTISQYVRSSSYEEKELINPNALWKTIDSRSEFERAYPYMPSRIIDNFVNGVPISVVDWDRIENDNFVLMKLIDNAFNRKNSVVYDHSAPLKGRNS